MKVDEEGNNSLREKAGKELNSLKEAEKEKSADDEPKPSTSSSTLSAKKVSLLFTNRDIYFDGCLL